MRPGVGYSSKAKAQLKALYSYIALHSNPDTAWRLVDDLTDRCEILSEFPKLGWARDDLRAGLRMIAFDRRITVAYSITRGRVKILGIFQRGEDFETALRGNPKADS